MKIGKFIDNWNKDNGTWLIYTLEMSTMPLTLFWGGGGVCVNKSFSGGMCAILLTPTNFWTTSDTELKFYMVIDIHKSFPKIGKKLG